MRFTTVERDPDAFQQPVTAEQVTAMCRRAFGADPVSAEEIGGGMYNNTYRVVVDRPVFLRVAPPAHRQARIERELMRNEHTSLPFYAPIAHMMPRTLFADFTHELLDRDYLVQTALGGVSAMDVARGFTEEQWHTFFRQLGTITRQVHDVRGTRFGPVAGPTFATWSEAVLSYVTDTAADLEDAGLDAADVRELAAVVERNAAVLDEITQPRLLHGDLWVPNVLLDQETFAITGVIDHDRSSWGDPAADWTIKEAGARPGTRRDVFWETYGQPADDGHSHWRATVYRAMHLGAARLERHRHGHPDKVAASYTELRTLLDGVRS